MTSQAPWIAYVGPVPFPEGGAAARRIMGNAKALVGAGYRVTVVSGQTAPNPSQPMPIAPGIDCVSTNERDAEHLPKALRYSRYALMGSRSRKWLDEQHTLPAAVVVYSGYSPYLLQLSGWAHRRGILIVFDAVEWYTAQTTLGFCTSPYLWNTEFAMRVLIPRCNGVIAISKSLEAYYRGKGLPVCRVPPLFDPEETKARYQANPSGVPLRLVYAGSPGKKDLLDTVLAGVLKVNETPDQARRAVVLDIAGVSEAELQQQPSLRHLNGAVPAYIRAHGRLAHQAALDLVSRADFSVFLREVNRVSTCGFATKFVESLSVGTPVITNITGDLGDHLHDGENGFISATPTADALFLALQRASSVSPQALKKMRYSARQTAENAFSCDRHITLLRGLFCNM